MTDADNGVMPENRDGCKQPSLIDLAARCEQAEGPSRALDRAIAAALQDDEHERSGTCPPLYVRPYTSSLDAALTLIPKTYGQWEIYAPDHNTLCWTAHLSRDANLRVATETGCANSLALAFCAAAIRACMSP